MSKKEARKNKRIKIRKDDEVIVICGRDKNKRGKVLRILRSDFRVVVQGVNIAKCHRKASASSEGGIQEQEMPIDISNVAFFDKTNNKATRIGYHRLEDGRKVRRAKVSGEIID